MESVSSPVMPESTLHSASGSDRSSTAKSNRTRKELSSQEWMTELSRSLQYGMTLQAWTESNLKAWLTSFTEGSPVRTLALQERALDWKGSEAGFFLKSQGLSKKLGLHGFSLKTYRQLELEAQLKFKKNFPPSGMILDGVLYPLPKLGPIIKGKDGFAWPTPTASGTPDCPAERKRKSPSLEAVVNMEKEKFPTPTAQDFKRRGPNSSQQGLSNTEHFTPHGGKLNPTWVEWLMGLNLGHTELRPWVTESCLFKRKRPSKS